MQDQFIVAQNGKIDDLAVVNTINKLRDEFGAIEARAIEAHLTLTRAYAVYTTAMAARYEALDISVPRFNVLRHLYHAEANRLTMSELGAYLNVSVPNVMRMVQALEAEDWLRSEKSDQDRRVTYVHLTATGLDRFRALLPRVLEIWEQLWTGLSPEEIETLSHLLSRVRINLLTRYIGRPGLLPYRLERGVPDSGSQTPLD